MHYLRTLLIVFVLLGCGMKSFSYAQGQSDTTFRHELGFGTNILLKGLLNTNAAPFDFIYRRHSGDGFLRVGLSLSVSNKVDYGKNNQRFDKYIRPELMVGKEWRQILHERWLVNYGGDIKTEYNRHSSRAIYEYIGRPSRESISLSVNYGVGVRPFVGVIFKVSERLFLTTEAAIITGLVRHYRSSGNYKLIVGERGEFQEDDKMKGWRYYFQTISASNIFVYYRF